MGTFGERVKQLREERGLNFYQLGKRSGLDPGYISRVENGQIKEPQSGVRTKFARGLEVSLAELVDEFPRPPESALADLEVSIKAYIPVYAEVCAGEGSEAIDYVASTRAKPAPESWRAYRVKGLCLEPIIKDGDTVIVDTALLPVNGDYIIAIIDGVAALWHFREDGQGSKWIEDDFRKLECKQSDDAYLIDDGNCIYHGVVVESVHKWRG